MGSIPSGISGERLTDEAHKTGFRPAIFEKAIRLLRILNTIEKHPSLKGQFTLSGGTALNLFHFDVPRLSVDIDLDFTGIEDRKEVMNVREKIDRGMEDVINRENYSVPSRDTDKHAASKWVLGYQPSTTGPSDNIKIDINYLNRVPLFDPEKRQSRKLGPFQSEPFRVHHLHELTSGKLRALFERDASRDLYDVNRLLSTDRLEVDQLRMGFLVYGGSSRKDWRDITTDDIRFDVRDIRNNLIPVLRESERKRISDPEKWGTELLEACKEKVELLLPLNKDEQTFMDSLEEKGEIRSEQLTDDEQFQSRIARNKGLLWRVQNVNQ